VTSSGIPLSEDPCEWIDFFTKSPIAMFLWVLILLSLAFPIFVKVKAARRNEGTSTGGP